MKLSTISWARTVGAALATGLLGTVIVTAADTQPVAPGAPGGGRPDRATRAAQGGGPGGAGGMGGMAGGMRGGGLDEEQRNLLQESRQKNSEELTKLNEQLRVAQKALATAVLADKLDEKVVREKSEAVAKVQVELDVLMTKMFAPVVPTLKPEQKDQFLNNPFFLRMMAGGMGGGPGGGRGGFGGGRGGMGGGPGGAPGGGAPQAPPK